VARDWHDRRFAAHVLVLARQLHLDLVQQRPRLDLVGVAVEGLEAAGLGGAAEAGGLGGEGASAGA